MKQLLFFLLGFVLVTAQAQPIEKLPSIKLKDAYGNEVDLRNLPVQTTSTDKHKKVTVVILYDKNGKSGKADKFLNTAISEKEDQSYFLWLVPMNVSLSEDQEKQLKENASIFSYRNARVLWDFNKGIEKYFTIDFNTLAGENGIITFFLDNQNNLIHCDNDDKLTVTKLNRIAQWIHAGVIAATGKLYFDKDWLPCVEALSAYYRVKEKIANSFVVKDYYKNGTLQMLGHYASIYPEIKQGEFIFYDSAAHKQSVENYTGNVLNGDFTQYYTNGNIYYTNERDGKGGYQDGLKTGFWNSYYDDGKKAGQVTFSKGLLNGKATLWDKTGKLLANLYFNKGKSDYNQPANFYLSVWDDSTNIEFIKIKDGFPQYRLKNKYTGSLTDIAYEREKKTLSIRGTDPENKINNFRYTFSGETSASLKLASVLEHAYDEEGILYSLFFRYVAGVSLPVEVELYNQTEHFRLIHGKPEVNNLKYTAYYRKSDKTVVELPLDKYLALKQADPDKRATAETQMIESVVDIAEKGTSFISKVQNELLNRYVNIFETYTKGLLPPAD